MGDAWRVIEDRPYRRGPRMALDRLGQLVLCQPGREKRIVDESPQVVHARRAVENRARRAGDGDAELASSVGWGELTPVCSDVLRPPIPRHRDLERLVPASAIALSTGRSGG